MRLDIASILIEVGNELEFDQPVKVDFTDDGIELEDSPLVKLRFVNAGDLVVANGTLDANVLLQCSRCLNKFPQKMHLEVCEEFAFNAAELNKEKADSEENEIWPIDSDNTIDLTEVIRQNIVLELPMKSVCRPDCGLDKDNSAVEKKIDPRWMKLKELNKGSKF